MNTIHQSDLNLSRYSIRLDMALVNRFDPTFRKECFLTRNKVDGYNVRTSFFPYFDTLTSTINSIDNLYNMPIYKTGKIKKQHLKITYKKIREQF